MTKETGALSPKEVLDQLGAGAVTPSGPVELTKSRPMTKKVVIGSGFSTTDLLALDSAGHDLVFEQTTEFLAIDDSIVKQLSSLNRTRYSMAKEFHDAWRGDEHAAFVESFKVDKQMVGSATDKITTDTVRGLHTRWTRPDRLDEMQRRGYRVLSKDEVSTFLGPTGGHHKIGRLGQTELVLMGIPNELHKQQQADKVRKNNEMAGAYATTAVSEMRQAGAAPFKVRDESVDREHNWTELDSN